MTAFIKDRKRLILVIIMVTLALFVTAKVGYQSIYLDYTTKSEELAQKIDQLEKYKKIMAKDEAVKNQNEEISKLFSKVKEKLIKAETKSMASAKLQEKINELAEDADIDITSYKELDPREHEKFMRVGGQIAASCSMRELTGFIHSIENSDIYMAITDLNIKALKDPQGVNVGLKIFGVAEIVVSGQ